MSSINNYIEAYNNTDIPDWLNLGCNNMLCTNANITNLTSNNITTNNTTQNLTFSCQGGAASSQVTIQLSKIGNMVTIFIPVFSCTASNGSPNAVLSSVALPAGFIPALSTNIGVAYCSGAAIPGSAFCQVTITSAGIIQIYLLGIGAFVNGQPISLVQGSSYSYLV